MRVYIGNSFHHTNQLYTSKYGTPAAITKLSRENIFSKKIFLTERSSIFFRSAQSSRPVTWTKLLPDFNHSKRFFRFSEINDLTRQSL